MIWESDPWKMDLQKIANRLEKASQLKQITDESDIRFEKDCFIAAYIIWKLLHSNKLSDEAKEDLYSLTWFSYSVPFDEYECSRGSVFDIHNHHKWYKFYKLEQPHQERKKIEYICNQLRHSFVFAPTVHEDERGYEGFFFNSDFTRQERVNFLTLPTFINLITTISTDNIINARRIYNVNTGKWDQYASRSFGEEIIPGVEV